ncbi:MAG TPA: S8 family serine peptidase, partial [Rugosimonospora sp.]|nr:S8 family serine peptidase [Rugosimonospora sp.]
LPPTFRGHGVRIAIIDSGAAAGHPDLSGRVTAGWDLAGGDGWRVDTVGHGSHAAGIIGGSDNGTGIIGVVPEAELHSCRIFPDGRLGDLIEALDYCLAAGVDVVNLSLGSAQPSALVARKIEQLRQAGVACVAAAGDTGGPVAFPASLPTVLAVAAIGRTGEYPPESYHATQVSGTPTAAGYFSARFTGHGPEVDVCAPGVAVISSVPPAGYAAWDGTACAAPYVTGLAALLLAHHPDFRERYASRDAARVDRLFALIRSTCQPLALGDPGEHSRSRGWAQASTPNVDRGRTGAGLPDAEAALGLKPPVTLIPPADPTMAALWTALAHAGLVSTPVPVTTPAAATPRGPDVLAPLRAALRAAGLLAYQPASE